MKRSPAFYQNKKMLTNLEDDDCRFSASIKDVEEWFVILNEQIFGNKLDPFGAIVVRKDFEFHALFHYWPKHHNQPHYLEISKTFDSKKLFVEILAHEMIHLFQYQYNEPLGHGASFWMWRDNLNLKGLTLHKVA